MLKSCLPYLGSPDCFEKNEGKSKELLEGQNNNNNNNNCPSFESSFQSKYIFVRVVHAGGKVEHYPNAVLAAKLLENLPPGKWLARPEVFKNPHESIMSPEEYLLPGHKYYVIPLSTIDKLKRKHDKMAAAGNSNNNNNNNNNIIDGIKGVQVENVDIITRSSEEISSSDHHVSSALKLAATSTDHSTHEEIMDDDDDDSFCSASDFYARKKKWSKSNNIGNNGSSGGSRRGRILLPIAKQKASAGYTWEPGLTSIKELSP